MRIAINALSIIPGKVGGTENFLVNLVKNIGKLDKKNKFLIVVTSNNKRIFTYPFQNVEYLEFNFDNNFRLARVFFEQIILPRKLKEKRIDLLIAPTNTGLILSPCKVLLVVHDLIYFIRPECFPFMKRIYLQNFVKYSCQKADRIVTVSQTTKNDIVKYTNVNKDKIYVIYEGVDVEKFSKIQKAIAKKFIQNQYGIQHYIYSPTSLHPHKNNDLLIKAFLKLKKTKKLPHKLIITGIDPFNKAGWLKSLIHKYNLDNEVFYFGWISREYIPFFYKGADLVVYLSSYEGFGLPVLEAMASGCPILASNRGSLPEVVAQAGITVDPENIRDVSLKMYDLLTNKTIKEYYINKGFSRAKKFSWEGVAKRVIKIYSSL